MSGAAQWLPLHREFPVGAGAVGGLAKDWDVEAYTQVIRHPITDQDFRSGRLEGLRVAIAVAPDADVIGFPYVTVLLVPQGHWIPELRLQTMRKESDRYIWAEKALVPWGPYSQSVRYFGDLVVHTSRRFDAGDELRFHISNRTSGTWGAGAKEGFFGEVYIRED